MQDYLYTVEEVAQILKVNKNTVYELIKSEVLVGLKLGRLKVTKTSLTRFLEEYDGKDLSDLRDIRTLTF